MYLCIYKIDYFKSTIKTLINEFLFNLKWAKATKKISFQIIFIIVVIVPLDLRFARSWVFSSSCGERELMVEEIREGASYIYYIYCIFAFNS